MISIIWSFNSHGNDIFQKIMDNLTKAQRSYNMSRIRSNNTKLEQRFFELLEEYKIPYIKHPDLFGKPDCQIGRILIFIDSDFWHGWHFIEWKNRLPKKYWVGKIEKNIKRDQNKFRKLKKQGYQVIRIWGHELKKDNNKLLNKIFKYQSK